MKKVGIITSYLDFDKNYGGVLQAYALSQIVKDLGFETYIMPYVYEHMTEEEKRTGTVHKILRRIRRSVRELFNPNLKKQSDSFKNMTRFVNMHLPIYSSERVAVAELSKIANGFYAFISGSDQVWNTNNQKNHCDPGMFLSFVPDGVKRIAYAPSLGSAITMSDATAQEFSSAISKYDALSVRERNGQETIKNVTGLDVPVVLDPTLLLPVEKWQSFAEHVDHLPEKYILLYRFGDLETTNQAIKDVQQKYKLPVLELPSSAVSLRDGYKKLFNINPAQFIGLIKNATIVLTDSFHCTVFSILMKSQFLTFYRQPDNKANMNGRVIDLLSLSGLESRLIKPGDAVNYDIISDAEFNSAHKNINGLKQFSMKYLKDSFA